jgi:hypothetical protein
MKLPYNFPDSRAEAFRQAQEFQRLSVADRVAAMLDTIATGMYLLSVSPRRAEMDRVFLEREAAWQGIQKELIRRHGQ